MFSHKTKDQLDTRENHLRELVSGLRGMVARITEPRLDERREQLLANLANFAYDPVNYDFFEALGVPALFLEIMVLTLNTTGPVVRPGHRDTLLEFAVGGICNLSLDPRFQAQLSSGQGVTLVIRCLSSENTETGCRP